MLAGAVLMVVPLAGCSSSDNGGKTTAPTPTVVPSTSFIGVPAAEVGKPFRFQMPTANGAVNLEITVASMKTRPGSGPKGTVTVCVAGRLANVGTTSYEAGDTGAQWFGLDGQQADVKPGTIGDCGGGTVWAGIDQPAPLPGKYVTGTWMYSVPDRPGAIEVTDSVGHPLYRLDYGPQSAQVKINAVGQ